MIGLGTGYPVAITQVPGPGFKFHLTYVCNKSKEQKPQLGEVGASQLMILVVSLTKALRVIER